jgi:hypothetical protein
MILILEVMKIQKKLNNKDQAEIIMMNSILISQGKRKSKKKVQVRQLQHQMVAVWLICLILILMIIRLPNSNSHLQI